MHEGWCAPNETPVSVSTTPQATATMAGVSKARFQTNKYSTMPSERSSCVDESTMFDQNGKCDAANIQEASEQHLSGDNLANEDDFEIEYDQEPDVGVRTRKPYTITRARKSWTDEEHNGFLDALSRYGRNWKHIQNAIGSKTVIQIRSHAQKYFLKLEKKGSGEHVPPPRPKRKSSRPYPKAQGSSKTPSDARKVAVEAREDQDAGKSISKNMIGVSDTGTSSRDRTSCMGMGPSDSSSLFVTESFGSTSGQKSMHSLEQQPGIETSKTPRLEGRVELAPAIQRRCGAGRSDAVATTSSTAKRSSSFVNLKECLCPKKKALKSLSRQLNMVPDAHETGPDMLTTIMQGCGFAGDSSNKACLSAKSTADGTAARTIEEPASGTPEISTTKDPAATNCGSVPGDGGGSATTSGSGSKIAAPQASDADDAEPSGGSADCCKGSGDSAGQNSNCTGKSEAADDTATTMRAGIGAGKHADMINDRASPDLSSGDTDNGSGGGSNDDNDEASPQQQEHGHQGSSMKPTGHHPQWKPSKHSLELEFEPRPSGDGGGSCGGGSSKSTHEPVHQRHPKRSVSQHNSTCCRYPHDHCENRKQTCRRSSGSENNEEDSTGSDQQGQSQTQQQVHARQCGKQHGLDECNTSHTQDHSSNLDATGKLLEREAGAPNSCYPSTSSIHKWPRSMNGAETNPEALEHMEDKKMMDSGSADDDSLGGITGLSLAFSNDMLMDEDSDPIGAGTESRETMPFAQATSVNVDQSEMPSCETPIWTVNSHVHPIHTPHSQKHSQPQQTQSFNSKTCSCQTKPVYKTGVQMHNQQAHVHESRFQSEFEAPATLTQGHGMLGNTAGWANTNNLNTGPGLAEQSLGNTLSDANFMEVYRMLADHCDPTVEDKQLQQEIGELHPMEQRTFDVLMGNMCRAFMSQEGQQAPQMFGRTNGQGRAIIDHSMFNQHQHLQGELPISFTLAPSQVVNGGLPLQSSLTGEDDESYDAGLTVTFNMHSTAQWR